MSEKVKAYYEKVKKDMGKVQTLAPDMMKGFGSLFTSVMKEGALPLKYKELIALAMGVGSCCEPCINLHVKKCLNAGATKEEIMEAASVAVVMQGGPAYTYMPAVVDALEANGQ